MLKNVTKKSKPSWPESLDPTISVEYYLCQETRCLAALTAVTVSIVVFRYGFMRTLYHLDDRYRQGIWYRSHSLQYRLLGQYAAKTRSLPMSVSLCNVQLTVTKNQKCHLDLNFPCQVELEPKLTFS